MTVTVENATWRGQPCYLVHANSHGSVDQVPIGTSVTGMQSILIKKLKTCTVVLLSYRNVSESLGEREMLWEHKLQQVFPQLF